MSISGKLARGKKYLQHIVAIEQPGYVPYGEVFLAEGILNDANKMKDVDYYKNSIKTVTKPVIKDKPVIKPTPKPVIKAKEE